MLLLLACTSTEDSALPPGPEDSARETAVEAYDPAPDHAALTEGLESLEFGGSIPSALVVHGPKAFPVVMAGGVPVMAAGVHGEGKVVVVGHEGQLGALLPHVQAWSGGETVASEPSLGLGEAAVMPGEHDVWVTSTYSTLSTEDAAEIVAWVEAGGTLLAGGHAWWWGYSEGRSDAAEGYSFNQVLSELGLTITVESGPNGSVPVQTPHFELDHSRHALAALEQHEAGTRSLTLDEQVQGAEAAGLAITHLPIGWAWFDRARAFVESLPNVIPTESDPVEPASEPIDHLVVRVGAKIAAEGELDDLSANPAAADFPGTEHTPLGEVTRTLALAYDGLDSIYGYAGAGKDAWVAADVWVPAGGQVTVRFDQDLTGLGLQVGAHTDTLWHLDSWSRSPQVTRHWPIEGDSITVGSAFGGLLYVTVPAGTDRGEVQLTITGASDGPWVEHRGEQFAIVVPRDTPVDDPAALMDFWDGVLTAEHALAGYPDWPRLERAVCDRQISAGWMHSGYPFMAHLASAEEFLDLDGLKTSGDWGAFHELGHNHQDLAWVLPGTTEANVNLFSVYVMEEVVGIDRSQGHSALDPASRQERIESYVTSGSFSSDWSVWTALETYLQLQEAFGWEPLTTVMVEYRNASDRPNSDSEAIHQWMVRSSRAVEMDLTPFYAAWKFPDTEAAAAELTDLPDWTDHPMAN